MEQEQATGLADKIGQVAMRLAKDDRYCHRAAEDLLAIAAELRAHRLQQPASVDALAANKEVAALILDNDRAGAVQWAKGLLLSDGLVKVDPASVEGWIAVDERMPEPETECIVWCREAAPGFGPFAKIDTWDEQHEAPVSFSSATIPVGLGWNDSDFEDVTHWMPLSAPPLSAPSSRGTEAQADNMNSSEQCALGDEISDRLIRTASADSAASVDALDAQRYRWLRDHDASGDSNIGVYRNAWDKMLRHWLHSDDLDAAIDAAMKGEAK